MSQHDSKCSASCSAPPCVHLGPGSGHARFNTWTPEQGQLRPFLLGYRQESPFTHMEPLPRPHPSHIAAIAGLLSLIPDLHQVEPILLPHKAFPPHCAPCLSLTLFLSCFETRSHSLGQAGLRLIIIFLPHPSKPWEYRFEPLCLLSSTLARVSCDLSVPGHQVGGLPICQPYYPSFEISQAQLLPGADILPGLGTLALFFYL